MSEIDPLLPAEQVALQTIRTYWEDLAAQPTKRDETSAGIKRDFLAGCSLIEQAMSPEVSADTAADYFETADDALHAVSRRPGITLEYNILARSAAAYIPAFDARRFDDDLSDRDFAGLRTSVSGILGDAQVAPLHRMKSHKSCTEDHPPCINTDYVRWRLANKLAMQLLFLREGEIAYPALWRETITRQSQAVAGQHAMYLMDGDQKIPYLPIDDREPVPAVGDNVIVFSYSDLVHQVRRKHFRNGSEAALNISAKHIGWLVHEVSGRPLEPFQSQFLNTLSGKLIDMADDFSA